MDAVQIGGKEVFAKVNFAILGFKPRTFSYPGSCATNTLVAKNIYCSTLHYIQLKTFCLKTFCQMFDNPATRPQLQALYNAEQSLLSFEGQQMQVTSHLIRLKIYRGHCSGFRTMEIQNPELYFKLYLSVMQGSAKIMEKLGSLTFQVQSPASTAFSAQIQI